MFIKFLHKPNNKKVQKHHYLFHFSIFQLIAEASNTIKALTDHIFESSGVDWSVKCLRST